MKKLLMLIVMVVMAVSVMAQSTNKISYQAVVRDANNRLAANTEVKVKVTIGDYSETFTVNTNANGLVSLQIPSTASTDFDAIVWSTATIKTEVTIGTDPAVVNEVPVTAVPFALYSSDVNPSGTTVQAIYTKIQDDSTALADQINTVNNTLSTKIKNDSTALAGQINTFNTELTTKIQGDSVALADQINTVNNTLTTKIKNDSTALAGNINANKQAIIDTAANIRSAVNANAVNIATNATNITDLNNTLVNDYTTTANLEANYTKTTDLPVTIAPQLHDTANNVRAEMDAKLADYVTKTMAHNDSLALATALQDNIDTTSQNIRNAIPKEKKAKFAAAAGQTDFDLGTEPNTTNAYVKMFINGIMVGDNEDGVITISGTTATYVPAENGGYELKADDRIVFYFFK
jgi:hypothetical protein